MPRVPKADDVRAFYMTKCMPEVKRDCWFVLFSLNRYKAITYRIQVDLRELNLIFLYYED